MISPAPDTPDFGFSQSTVNGPAADTDDLKCNHLAGPVSHSVDTNDLMSQDVSELECVDIDTKDVGNCNGAELVPYPSHTEEFGYGDGMGPESSTTSAADLRSRNEVGQVSHEAHSVESGRQGVIHSTCHNRKELAIHFVDNNEFGCQNIAGVDSYSSDTDELKFRDGDDSHSNPIDCGRSGGEGANPANPESNDIRPCNVAASESQTNESKEFGCRTGVGINTHPTDTEDHWNLRGARNLEMMVRRHQNLLCFFGPVYFTKVKFGRELLLV